MRKFFAFIVMITVLSTIIVPVCAYNYSGLDYVYNRNMSFFEYYELVDGDKISSEDMITRREALEILCNVFYQSYAECLVMPKDEINAYYGDIFEITFDDVEQNSNDHILTGLAYYWFGILRGSPGENGMNLARLDDQLTLKEALIFCERLLLFADEDTYKLKVGAIDGEWFEIAQTAGIINYQSYYYQDPVTFVKEGAETPITFYNFLHILYYTVHTPFWWYGYSGADVGCLADFMKTKEELELT